MREILFRGICNFGELEGQMIESKTIYQRFLKENLVKLLIGSDWFEIDPKTLSQWTGLVDCKGNKIFEGDILCFKSKFSEKKQYFEIEWNNEITNCGCCYDVWGVGFDFSDLVDSNYEVIGNRFQNPELINNKNQ